MYKVSIEPHWRIAYGNNAEIDTVLLLKLLASIQSDGAILQAAKTVNLSYRHAWGLLREAERIFGGTLLEKKRGRGTRLTHLATTLLWADRRIAARLSPTLESLASELKNELGKSIEIQQNATRIIARHGFAVDALLKHIKTAKLPIELRYLSSTGAVGALTRDECDLAGFHIPLGELENTSIERYAHLLDPDKHCLIHLAILNQGIFTANDNPKNIHTLADLSKNDVRFVNRQDGSGTRILLEKLLAKHNIASSSINGYETEEFTHAAIAAFIASGMADAGFGMETAARRFDLNFVPLVRERYFFAVSKEKLEQAPIKEILTILQNAEFKAQVDELSGYDATQTGQVFSLKDAFSDTF